MASTTRFGGPAALAEVRDNIPLITCNRPPALNAAPQIALTGAAATAAAWGQMNHVVADDAVLASALDLGVRIAANTPLSISHTKEVIHHALNTGSDWRADWSGDDPWGVDAAAMRSVFASRDALEGPRAFAEKREPRWVGRQVAAR